MWSLVRVLPRSRTCHTVYAVTPPNEIKRATKPAKIFPGSVSFILCKFYHTIDVGAGGMIPASVLIRTVSYPGQGDADVIAAK